MLIDIHISILDRVTVRQAFFGPNFGKVAAIGDGFGPQFGKVGTIGGKKKCKVGTIGGGCGPSVDLDTLSKGENGRFFDTVDKIKGSSGQLAASGRMAFSSPRKSPTCQT